MSHESFETPPPRRRGRLIRLLPVVPAVALLSAVVLPFVNGPHLWFGVPSLFVWTSVWVLLVTPCLFAVELTGNGPDGTEQDR